MFSGSLSAALDQAPHQGTDPVSGVTGALADPATVDRIVAAVRAIISDGGAIP